MYIPGISAARLNRRGSVNRGGGRNEGDDDKTGGGNGDERGLYSGESNASSGYGLRISDVDGLPEDNNEAIAYGAGYREGDYSVFNNTRPAGEMAEATISPDANDSASSFSISDGYSIIQGNHGNRVARDWVSFDSTDNLQLGTTAQSLCGDAIFLRGHDDEELPNDQIIVSNHPFPSTLYTWECLDYTTGEPVPFVSAAPGTAHQLLPWEIPSLSPSFG